ncbi:MAG TPA: preprotein translocase subunit SecG [Sphingomicrobium sp.]|nr:preprotein translocase subunit SecG [Sphingomicrobium sp.]
MAADFAISFESRSMLFTFLLIVQTMVAAALVSVILMQRSEGGGLGVGGSSSGFMTARGASDFLTRSTAILGGLFVVLSITLAAIAGVSGEAVEIDTTLANQAAPIAPAPQGPPLADPGAGGAAGQPQPPAAGNQAEPAVPLAE